MTAASSLPPPSPWVERCATLIAPGGTVLDIACGTGRHSNMFAATGHKVTAIDIDISRLIPRRGIEAIGADLEDGTPWPLPGRLFDGVVVTNYLYRPLFPILIDSLNPGGVLIYETFAIGNEHLGRPRNPDFLLHDGELLEAVAGKLVVIAYEAGRTDNPAPAIVQRIAAIKTETEMPAIPPRA
ncbi:MAG: class I SAM-dependent methyltransferase [Rhodospirillaceae bacterium]|nr:class I SAM-dependent methyltransferase [Rhodospirillaceae bacterium]